MFLMTMIFATSS